VPAKRVRFGIKTAQMDGPYAGMREAWLEADRLGFDTAWGHDHLLNQDDLSAPEEEGWTILAALLAQTTRIRGGLMVTSNTFRAPGLLAKMATTVDIISGGRLEVGLGAGWLAAEHEQYGIEYGTLGERIRRLDEACRILRSLWTHERTTFEGRYFRLEAAYHEPKPIQKPHPPLVIGAKGEKVMLRIVAEHADEWNLSGGSPDEFRHKSAVLDEHCRAIGRDPATIQRSVQLIGERMEGDVVSRARDFIEAGATHVVFGCPEPFSAEAARWLWHDVVGRVRT
jgi:F420-dependent oxidoreductase-like protein